MPRTHPNPVTSPSLCQIAPAKGSSFNSLPQSKSALPEPLRIEPLATPPPPRGVPLSAHRRTLVSQR